LGVSVFRSWSASLGGGRGGHYIGEQRKTEKPGKHKRQEANHDESPIFLLFLSYALQGARQ
jgi:hypothetical protein